MAELPVVFFGVYCNGVESRRCFTSGSLGKLEMTVLGSGWQFWDWGW